MSFIYITVGFILAFLVLFNIFKWCKKLEYGEQTDRRTATNNHNPAHANYGSHYNSQLNTNRDTQRYWDGNHGREDTQVNPPVFHVAVHMPVPVFNNQAEDAPPKYEELEFPKGSSSLHM